MKNLPLYENAQKEIEKLDKEYIEIHNAKYGVDSPYHLHREMRPGPFEGDLLKARVVLLLGNPHFLPGESTPVDHVPIEDWGLWGLNESCGTSKWWRPRIRRLLSNSDDNNLWHAMSLKMASFQTVAWASPRFHHCKRLPSKELQKSWLRSLAAERKDTLFVVMRNRAYWDSVLEKTPARRIYTRNPRCSYLTKNNFNTDYDWNVLSECLT